MEEAGEREGERERTAALGRLRWHCRRALLELDLVFQRFWTRQGELPLDKKDEVALERLLEFEDHDLWALVSGRQITDDAEVARMIQRLREV